jgi:drug/metabolite transporter (DMT)-like permease
MTIQPTQNSLLGVLLMLAAMSILPFIDVIAKYLGNEGLPVPVIVWGRLVFGVIFVAPFLFARHGPSGIVPDQPFMHMARGALMCFATFAFFLALRYLPIADTLAIFFVQPLLITAFSPLLLGEHVGVRRWAAVAVGFVGTLIIIRPGFQEFNLGVPLALAAGVAFALNMILTRMAAGKSPPLMMIFHTNGFALIIASAALAWFWQMPTPAQWGFLALLAAVAAFGHYLIVIAYGHGEASLLAPLGYTEMVTAVIAGWYFFGDFPDKWTFLGSAILIASAIYIAQRERVRKVEPVKEAPRP